MNLLRGDVARLGRCVAITTGSSVVESPTREDCATKGCDGVAVGASDCSAGQASLAADETSTGVPAMRLVPRCKPLKYAYEKEIVLYGSLLCM